jgi:hypothetical protein
MAGSPCRDAARQPHSYPNLGEQLSILNGQGNQSVALLACRQFFHVKRPIGEHGSADATAARPECPQPVRVCVCVHAPE